jgi:hypothetical protein
MLPLPTLAYCICVPVGSQPQGRRTITPEGWPSKASRHLLARIYLELMAFGVERVRDWAPHARERPVEIPKVSVSLGGESDGAEARGSP